MLRSILKLKIKDHVKIEEIVSQTKAKNIWATIKKLKWNYAGHLARENVMKWNRILTMWVPHQGYRNKGRPVKRWADELVQEIGSHWPSVAKDRAKWRDATESYTRKRVAEGGVSAGWVHPPK